MRSTLRWRCVAGLVGCLALACQNTAPGNRGQPVGFAARAWVDGARTAWKNDEPRPLNTVVWYPAASGTREKPAVVGPPGLAFFRLGWVATGALPEPTSKRRPLVVLSHGTGGSATDLSWLAEPLAARGFLVAAVTHHGNSIAGRDLAPEGFFLWWERAEDLQRILDQLERDTVFGPLIDPARIGAAGFSLGGNTVLLLGGARIDLADFRTWCEGPGRDSVNCRPPPEALAMADEKIDWEAPKTVASLARSDLTYRDPRIRAVYSIAPAVAIALTPDSLAAIDVPVQVVVGADDRMAPADVNAEHVAAHAGRANLLTLPGVDHYTFLPTCGWAGRWLLGEVCAERRERPRARVHEQVAADALDFFTDHLKLN